MLSTTHAVNSVASILAFDFSVSPWWSYTTARHERRRVRQPRLRSGGGRDEAPSTTGDWWYEAFGPTSGGRLTRRHRNLRRGPADHRGGDQLCAVRHRLDHVRRWQASGSGHPGETSRSRSSWPASCPACRSGSPTSAVGWFSGWHSSGSAYGIEPISDRRSGVGGQQLWDELNPPSPRAAAPWINARSCRCQRGVRPLGEQLDA